MAIKYLSSINLSKNEIQNVVVHNLAAAPSNPKEGQIYYDTSSTEVYVCINETGPVWQSMKGDITAVTASTGLSGGGTDGAVSLALKNNANFTGNTILKWDSGNGQLTDSSITDDGTTVTITADLTVTGTTTTVNTETINLADNIILLNSNLAGDAAPSQDAGIEIERGTEANVQFIWDEGSDYWSTVDQKLHIGSIDDITAADANQLLVSDSGVVKKVDASDVLDLINIATESGSASPAVGELTFTAGEGINTSGSGSTVTIAAEEATESNKGVVELATTTEAETGTDTVRAITPAGLEAHYDSKGYSADITAAASVAVSHGLGSQDVIVQLRETASPYAYVMCDVEATDTDSVTLRFGAGIGTDYRVIIQRVG
mgnify:FL=1